MRPNLDVARAVSCLRLKGERVGTGAIPATLGEIEQRLIRPNRNQKYAPSRNNLSNELTICTPAVRRSCA